MFNDKLKLTDNKFIIVYRKYGIRLYFGALAMFFVVILTRFFSCKDVLPPIRGCR